VRAAAAGIRTFPLRGHVSPGHGSRESVYDSDTSGTTGAGCCADYRPLIYNIIRTLSTDAPALRQYHKRTLRRSSSDHSTDAARCALAPAADRL